MSAPGAPRRLRLPRGLRGAALTARARILAAADIYQAMTEPRPHRDARSAAEAGAQLRAEVRTGKIDASAADAVLQAAGHTVTKRPEQAAGLTAREIEVLRLLARGLQTKQIAQELVITPRPSAITSATSTRRSAHAIASARASSRPSTACSKKIGKAPDVSADRPAYRHGRPLRQPRLKETGRAARHCAAHNLRRNRQPEYDRARGDGFIPQNQLRDLAVDGGGLGPRPEMDVGGFAAVSENLLEALQPRPAQTILELAAGTGETGFVAARAIGPTGRVISTDFAPEMVAAARHESKRLGLANVEHRELDAERMDLEDNSVDGVLCRWGYMLIGRSREGAGGDPARPSPGRAAIAVGMGRRRAQPVGICRRKALMETPARSRPVQKTRASSRWRTPAGALAPAGRGLR